MFCEHFVLYDAGVEFIAVGEVRPDIFAALHVVPTDIRIAEKNPKLMFSGTLPIY